MPFFNRINSLRTFKDFYLKNIEYNLQEEISHVETSEGAQKSKRRRSHKHVFFLFISFFSN